MKFTVINLLLLNFLLLVGLTVLSCTADEPLPQVDFKGYPEEIADIVLTQCATSGCHNDESKGAAAGLSLSSWDNMMEGSRNGAITVPYSHGFSTFFLFTNTYEDLGVSVGPTMPFGGMPLSQDDVLKIRLWINRGAPNSKGLVKFSDNPQRKKYYVLNRGCDMVTVFDWETDLIARFVKVTFGLDVEDVESLVLAPDGQHWYIVSPGGDVVRKYRVADDSLVGTLLLGDGKWTTLSISNDSKKAFVINSDSNGSIAYVNLEEMSLVKKYEAPNLFESPSSAYIDDLDQTLYVTAGSGNFIYKIDITDPLNLVVDKVVLQTGQLPSTLSEFDPKEIFIDPDGDKYYVTCSKSNEVRCFSISDDHLLSTIPVGLGPSKMAYSPSKDYLFVSCPDDSLSFTGLRGSISVIDCQSHAIVDKIYPGSQPNGMVVDEATQRLIVANRNFTSDGPRPHHVTECEGRNGYVTYIDLNTLALIPDKKFEVSVDPFAVAITR
ncbi:MAG: YncE family protein [Bacteroidota bacterium]